MTWLIDFVRFTLIATGLIYLVTTASIFAPLRIALARRSNLLLGLLYCTKCVGFWVGMTLAWLMGGPFDLWWVHPDTWSRLFIVVEGGVVTMGVQWILEPLLVTGWATESALVLEVGDEQETGGRGDGDGGGSRGGRRERNLGSSDVNQDTHRRGRICSDISVYGGR